ncbi:uncharacterized protein M6G45_009112 isoform 4-T8 [Spheniscus humboldti]
MELDAQEQRIYQLQTKQRERQAELEQKCSRIQQLSQDLEASHQLQEEAQKQACLPSSTSPPERLHNTVERAQGACSSLKQNSGSGEAEPLGTAHVCPTLGHRASLNQTPTAVECGHAFTPVARIPAEIPPSLTLPSTKAIVIQAMGLLTANVAQGQAHTLQLTQPARFSAEERLASSLKSSARWLPLTFHHSAQAHLTSECSWSPCR